jgi:hypothetical protein
MEKGTRDVQLTCSVTKTFMTLLFAIVPSFTAQADGPFLAAGIRSVTRIQHRYDLTSATRVLVTRSVESGLQVRVYKVSEVLVSAVTKEHQQ